jgi:methionyl-tRNA synthetase
MSSEILRSLHILDDMTSYGRPQPVPAGAEDLDLVCRLAGDRVGAALAEFDFRQATAAVWAIADEANRFINRVRPWELARAERDGDTLAGRRLDAVLSALFGACLALGAELEPFLPDAAARITRQCTPCDERLPDPAPVFRRLG